MARGYALMIADPLPFAELMLDAQRAVAALESLTKWDGSRAKAAAVKDGRRVCSRLMDYQRTVWMTKGEVAALQAALDLLRVRLGSWGEPV
jgi:hypothetical protein